MTLGLDGCPNIGPVKRRIAAAATSAALAVAGPAAAADRSGQRNGQPRSAKPRVTRVAEADNAAARQSLAVMQRQEMARHRHHLAAALAVELPSVTAEGIERGLAVAGADPGGSLASSTGRSEDEIEAAFEAMARHARESRLRS